MGGNCTCRIWVWANLCQTVNSLSGFIRLTPSLGFNSVLQFTADAFTTFISDMHPNDLLGQAWHLSVDDGGLVDFGDCETCRVMPLLSAA